MFTAGLDHTWSVDTQFNIDLQSGDGRRADKKRTRDAGEPVRRPDAVLVVDAKGVVHNEACDEQANAHVTKKKMRTPNESARPRIQFSDRAVDGEAGLRTRDLDPRTTKRWPVTTQKGKALADHRVGKQRWRCIAKSGHSMALYEIIAHAIRKCIDRIPDGIINFLMINSETNDFFRVTPSTFA